MDHDQAANPTSPDLEKAIHTAKTAMENMVWVPGGTFLMGSDQHYPEEAPAHHVTVEGFWIDNHTVTHEEFRRFVEATKYVTTAERARNPEDHPGAKPELLAPVSVVFQKLRHRVDLHDCYQCWTYVPGANWRHPEGPASSLKGRAKHPVVHVAYEDAAAYAKWCGKELPTEADWEFAARGGLYGAEFVWGDSFKPDGKHQANTWQGEFPWQNLEEDGFAGTAPVGSFPANGYGLYDMAGNVWEWTTDWYQEHSTAIHSCCAGFNPIGAERDKSYGPNPPDIKIACKVIKGGSFLCAPNCCSHYRPAARMAQPVDTATCHLGFRCIVRVAKADL